MLTEEQPPSPSVPPSPRGPGFQRHTNLLVGAVTVAFYVAISLWAGVGVLGDDPYWYAGDLSMMRATGEATTNVIFPSTLLDASISPGHLPHWIHNIPVTHVISWLRPGSVTSYFAFLIANIVLAMATAFMIFVIARRAGMRWPVVSVVLFLAFPLTMVFTVYASSEMYLAFAVAATALGAQQAIAKTGAYIGLGISGAGIVLLYFSRDSFVLAVPAFFIFCLLVTKDAKGRLRMKRALPFQLAILAAVLMKSWLFTAYPTAGFNSLLMSSTSQSPSNMSSFDSTHAEVFRFGPFLSKAGFGLYRALVPNGVFELVVETTLLVVLALGIWVFRRESRTWPLRYWAVVFLGIYIASNAVFQPGYRYLYSIAPVACIFANGLWEQAIDKSKFTHPERLIRAFSLSLITLMIAFSSVIAFSYRTTGLKTNEQIHAMSLQISQSGKMPILVIANREQMMPLTYAALPRPVISLDRKVNSFDDAARLIKRWKPGVFVSGSAKDRAFLETALTRAYGRTSRLHRVDVLDTPGGDAEMFTIDTSQTEQNQPGVFRVP